MKAIKTLPGGSGSVSDLGFRSMDGDGSQCITQAIKLQIQPCLEAEAHARHDVVKGQQQRLMINRLPLRSVPDSFNIFKYFPEEYKHW